MVVRLFENYVGGGGYADDIFLLYPSLDGVQRMLYICENYAVIHNLKFSTNADPAKSKTKCLAFYSKETMGKRSNMGGHL